MDFEEAIRQLCHKDKRYTPQAYQLVRMSLDVAQKNVHGEIKKNKIQVNRHVTGPQLIEGFRQHVIETYGPMSFTILHNWGIKKSVDVGNIVFNIIETGMFGRSDDDTLEDFENVIDFKEAFMKPFEPQLKA
jgi:uncharacterized repeat protein (TIGR04138 family)